MAKMEFDLHAALVDEIAEGSLTNPTLYSQVLWGLCEICGYSRAVPYNFRDVCVALFGWAVPDLEALDLITRYAPGGVVEVGAGGGYWGRLLLREGIAWEGYDSDPARVPVESNLDAVVEALQELRACARRKAEFPGVMEPGGRFGTWTFGSPNCRLSPTGGARRIQWAPVGQQSGLPRTVSRDKALMLCWPPYEDPMAYQALSAYRGRTLIYVGESAMGCTGDAAFHAAVDRRWRREEQVGIPTWSGIHDRLEVWTRR